MKTSAFARMALAVLIAVPVAVVLQLAQEHGHAYDARFATNVLIGSWASFLVSALTRERGS